MSSVELSDYSDLNGGLRAGVKIGDEAEYHARDGRVYPIVVKSLAYSRPEAPGRLVRDCLFVEGLPDGPNTMLCVDEDRIRRAEPTKQP
jgi:hypothetical protein